MNTMTTGAACGGQRQRRSRFLLLALAGAVALVAAACAQQPSREINRGQLTVYAAASLREAFESLGKNFEKKNPEARITFSFAGSQLLARQLAEKAPADVFASANLGLMNTVAQAGRVNESSVTVFARNRLVIIVPKDNPAGVQSMADLARPGLTLVLANKTVPAGGYALDMLDKATAGGKFGANFRDAVLANVRSYEEDVRAAVLKTALAEADGTIAYATDAAGAQRDNLRIIDIPDAYNITASYPIAALTDAANPALAQAFVDYLLSQEGQAVLVAHGFMTAKQ